MDGTRANVFEHADGDWWAECLVCEAWVTTANATRREAEGKFGRHLENDPHPTRLCVWAMVDVGEPVSQETLDAVDAAWRRDDESFCSSPARHEPEVLALSFDVEVENDDYDAAFVSARKAVLDLAERVGLPGNVRPLTGYTDTHEWTESR